MMAMVALPAALAPPRAPRAEISAVVVAGCCAQDAASFRAFVVAHQRAVFACLSRIVGPSATGASGASVDDLAQETFLRAYRAFPAFDPAGPARVSTWLLTIATRLALDARKRRVLTLLPLERGEDVSTAVTPESEHARRQLGCALAQAAATLPGDQLAALVLSDHHGLSLEEIAVALETPVGTVKSRRSRAREKMRARLGDAWSER